MATKTRTKTRQHTSSVKDRKEQPTLVAPDRFAGVAAPGIPVKHEGSRDEQEAELTVTRICDSILGRLGDAEAENTRPLRKPPLRRRAD